MSNLLKIDPWLSPFAYHFNHQQALFQNALIELRDAHGSLKDFASIHKLLGLHKTQSGWTFKEWAPNATAITLIGTFSDWQKDPAFKLVRTDHGLWTIDLKPDQLKHGDLYKLIIEWPNGEGERLPSCCNRVIQDETTKLFTAQVYDPPTEFKWTDESFTIDKNTFKPIIYEAHVGMSSETEKVNSFVEFSKDVLPRIKQLGYNTIQLMAIQEHPYYGSFGYHVSNFFAVSSRFGTPDELKALINEAHQLGMVVIMDIVHSHAVKNELEGLSNFDGNRELYFTANDHPAWDSRCFAYYKPEVLKFLLSNCRYWLEEFHFDGFRFDGVTSMLYHHHGLGKDFTSYSDYFAGELNEPAITYLTLANQLIHEIKPTAITIAEEMSGYPGIAGKIEDGGIGFDYRLSMGVPDFWIKIIKEIPDEQWNVGQIFHELSQHRPEEQTINYAESHDQALVGDKTIIFRLADKDMYEHMSAQWRHMSIDRAIALHKMIRLITLSTASGGYLTFMGNEFGHPEWIDFPREGNGYSFKYARRQWSLVDNRALRFKQLNEFDQAMIQLVAGQNLLDKPLTHRFDNKQDQVLAFSRGQCLFVFNFSPDKSYTAYGIPVDAGKYQLTLSSDEEQFGGFNRQDKKHVYMANQLNKGQFQLLLYLPARTVQVFKQQELKRVHDI